MRVVWPPSRGVGGDGEERAQQAGPIGTLQLCAKRNYKRMLIQSNFQGGRELLIKSGKEGEEDRSGARKLGVVTRSGPGTRSLSSVNGYELPFRVNAKLTSSTM
jgi:hypothetical protein